MQEDFDLGPSGARAFANARAAEVHLSRHRHPARSGGWLRVAHQGTVTDLGPLPDVGRPGWAIGIAYFQERTGEWHVSVDNREREVQLDVWADGTDDLVPACQRAIDRHLVPA